MNLAFAIWLTACEPGQPTTWQDVAMAAVFAAGAGVAAWAVAWAQRSSK
jgi:hypothetical protein